MSKPDIHRLFELQKMLEAFNQIDRATRRVHAGTMRPENDTEHSYNLAMTAWYLAPHFPELEPAKLIQIALVHDLVEVYAGDTFVYGSAEELASKVDREAKALIQLKEEWPDFKEMIETLTAYEKRSSPEAYFVYALDKIMPIMQIYLHDGYVWKQNGITLKQLHAVKEPKVSFSPPIKHYYDQLYALLQDSPDYIKP